VGFECVVVNCSLLQQADDDEGTFFRTITLQSLRGGKLSFDEAVAAAPDWTHGRTHTHQGHFVGMADGRSLGSSFGHSDGGDATAAMLEAALAVWRVQHGMGEGAVVAGPPPPPLGRRDPQKSWPLVPGEDWLVLQLTCRDLEAPPAPTSKKQAETPAAFNNDFVWLAPGEVATLAPSSSAPPGTEYEAPGALAAKLARFHLIDSVRGEGVTWPAEAVLRASLTVKVAGHNTSAAGAKTTRLVLGGDFALAEQPAGARLGPGRGMLTLYAGCCRVRA
jgi:hypothetical protein